MRSNPHSRRGYSEVKTFHYGGAKFEILISTTNGRFTAWADTSWVEAPSLNGLQEKLRNYVKSSRSIEIPATLMDDYGPTDTKLKIEDVTLFGKDAKSGRVQYKDEDGNSQSAYYEHFFRRLTGEEKAEFRALVHAQWKAVTAVSEWVEAHEISASDEVEKAQAALSTAPPSEDPAGDGSAELEEGEAADVE